MAHFETSQLSLETKGDRYAKSLGDVEHTLPCVTKVAVVRDQAIAEAPESVKNALSRAFSGSASPRAAIKAFCLQCVGYVREDIKNCSADACALHAYRPFQGTSGRDELLPD